MQSFLWSLHSTTLPIETNNAKNVGIVIPYSSGYYTKQNSLAFEIKLTSFFFISQWHTFLLEEIYELKTCKIMVMTFSWFIYG